jgi:hypothetical protein
MKRITTVCLLLTVAACADNRSLIEIDGRAAPSDATACTFTPGGKNLLGPGLLDVASPLPAYSLVVYVTNNLADPGSLSPGSLTAAKAWTANAARVRINPSGFVDTFNPNPKLVAFQGENVVPLDGQTVQPAGGAVAQFVEAVSGPLGAQLAPLVAPGDLSRIVLGISLQGHTLDGARLETNEWYFPIDVCNGCLVSAAPTTCPTGQVLAQTNCFGPSQDSPPACQ